MEDNGRIVQVDTYIHTCKGRTSRASFGHIDRLMIAWNKGQTVTWSRGHVMDRFRPGQAPRRPATAFNPDRPRNRPTDRQTTRINQPDRPGHRRATIVSSRLLSSRPVPSPPLPSLLSEFVPPSFVRIRSVRSSYSSPHFRFRLDRGNYISNGGREEVGGGGGVARAAAFKQR